MTGVVLTARRGLQIVLAVLSVVPLSASLLTVTQGAERFLPPDAVVAELDHQLRYLAGYYGGVALVIWYVIPHIERHGALVTFVAGSVFLGGIARLVSVLDVGAATPVEYALVALELAMPSLILWQRRLAVTAAATTEGSAAARTGVPGPVGRRADPR